MDVASGGDEGFEAFVIARWSPMVTTAFLVTADRGIAEDCVQEALVGLYRRWRRVRQEGRVAYANRAVVNAALSWRRRRRLTEVPLSAEDHSPVLEARDPEGFDPRLLAALWSLPPRARAVVVLRFLEDRSEAETAAVLGCSVGTVKSLASRGRARMREALQGRRDGRRVGLGRADGVSERPVTAEDRMPDAVVENLLGAARASVADSVPFPRMHEAIRRHRRRRMAGGAAVAVAALVATTAVTATLRADHSPLPPSNRGSAPAQSPSPTQPGPDSDPPSLAGATAGSLAADRAWLDGMKQRLVRDGVASDTAHARVLAWQIASWRAATGATPEAMVSEAGPGYGYGTSNGDPLREDPQFVSFRVSDDALKGPGLLVVYGEGLSGVEVASGVEYTADGRKSATWRPLEPEAAVWTREVTAEEIDGVEVRARTADGLRRPLGGGRTYAQAPLPPGMAEVAPEGTDGDVLTCAAMAFAPERGGFPKGSTPVLGAPPVQEGTWYGIAVARAPGGGYLIGSCLAPYPEWSSSSGTENAQGYVVPAPEGGPASLFAMIAAKAGPPRGTETEDVPVVVVAPEAAAEVEVAGQTVPVRDRVAVLLLPAGTPEAGLTATARTSDGRTLGATGLAPTEREIDQEAFFDVDELGRPIRR